MQINCKACFETKPEDDFYRGAHGKGRMTTCKECWKTRVKERRRTNPAVQKYDRERANLPHRRAKAKKAVPRWRAANPEAYLAQNAINNAIRDGKLKRGACACGATKNVFGIARDPAKPLDAIQWRCARCHHRGRFAIPEGTQAIVLDTLHRHQRATP